MLESKNIMGGMLEIALFTVIHDDNTNTSNRELFEKSPYFLCSTIRTLVFGEQRLQFVLLSATHQIAHHLSKTGLRPGYQECVTI